MRIRLTLEIELTQLNSELESVGKLVQNHHARQFIEKEFDEFTTKLQSIEKDYDVIDYISTTCPRDLDRLYKKIVALEEDVFELIPKHCRPVAPLPDDDYLDDFTGFAYHVQNHLVYLLSVVDAYPKELKSFLLGLLHHQEDLRKIVDCYHMYPQKQKMWVRCIEFRRRLHEFKERISYSIDE